MMLTVIEGLSALQLGIIPALIGLAAAAIPIIWDALDDSDDEAQEDQRSNNAAAQEAWRALQSQIPELADTPLEAVTPDMLMQVSEMAGVEAEPAVVNAQRRALGELSRMSSGEMTAIERNAFDQAGREAGTRARGRREAILQNRQARGLGGSQDELVALLENNQGAADLENQRQLGIQSAAMQRALGALSQYGGLATQMRGQGFSEAAQRARAVDDFNRYNTDYRRGVQSRNAAAMERARQSQFGNRMGVAAGMTGQYNRQADQAERRYRDTQARDDQRLAAGIGLGTAAYRYLDEDDEDDDGGPKRLGDRGGY